MSSFLSHPSNDAILSRVCRSGCDVLVHHLLTVEAFLPNCSANHLLVFFFSTSTIFSLFKSFISIDVDLNANLMIYFQTTVIVSYILVFFQISISKCLYQYPPTRLHIAQQRNGCCETLIEVSFKSVPTMCLQL